MAKRGEWNSYLTDADQYKLNKKEILERKKLFISKNNLFIAPSATILNKQNERVHNKKSEIRSKEKKALIGRHRRSTSQSPFTINSSSAGTTQSADSDNGSNDSNPCSESDESILNHDDAKDLSSLDLLEQSCDHSYDQTVSQQLFQKHVPEVGKINKKISKNTKKKKSIQIIGKDSILNDIQMNSGYSKQIPLLESQTSAKEPESVANDGKYLIEMVQEIQSLRTELRYYEQLSGRKSILSGEELDAVLDLSSMNSRSLVNHRQILKYLVELVCQTMTYLLRSEVDLHSQKAKYDVLSTRLDSLTAFVSSLSLDSAMYSNKVDAVTIPSVSHTAPCSPVNTSMYRISDPTSSAAQIVDTQQKPTPNRELIPIRLFQSPIPTSQPSGAGAGAVSAQALFNKQNNSLRSEISQLETQYDNYLSLGERVMTLPSPTSSITSSASTLQLKFDAGVDNPTPFSIDTVHTIPFASSRTKSNPTMSTRFTPASASAVASPPQSLSLPPSQLGFPYGNHHVPPPQNFFSSGPSLPIKNNPGFSGTSASDWLFSPPPPPPHAPPPSVQSNGAPPSQSNTQSSARTSAPIKTSSSSSSSSSLNYSFGLATGEHTASSPGDIRKNLFPEQDLSIDSYGESFSSYDVYMSQIGCMDPSSSRGNEKGSLRSEQPSLIAPNQLSSLPLPQSIPKHPYCTSATSATRPSPDSIAFTSPATATNYSSSAVIQTLLSPHWGKDFGRVFDARLGSF